MAPSFLLINVSRIGDTMFATPAIRAIAEAHPGAEIAALGHRHRADVWRELPFLARVGAISKRTAPWRGRFDGRRHDYALVYGYDEPLVEYALRKATRVVAFRQKRAALNDRLYRCVEPPAFQSEHAVAQYLRLTSALGIGAQSRRLAYRVSGDEARAAREHLKVDVPREASPLIGLQIASFPTRSYRDWPVDYFAELSARIARARPQAHFLIYGGVAERARVQELKERLGARATLYAGRLTLRETAAIMSLTDLYVGVDTGPTHLMSTFDIPLVGLYHCVSSSKLTGPLDHPCFYAVDHPRKTGCIEQTDMAEISVDTVFGEVARALGEHEPAHSARHRA